MTRRRKARGWLRWYFFTRTLGSVTVVYELFFASGTAERGTIILAGFGVMGFDFVTRRDRVD